LNDFFWLRSWTLLEPEYLNGTDPNGGTGPPASDTTPPVISDINVSNIGQFSADISWTTNEDADGQIEFLGPCPATGCLTPLVSTLTTNHLINISGLIADTTYTYRVISTDSSGNTATSSNFTFVTSIVPTPTASMLVEAELFSLSSPMQIGNDSNALGGQYIHPVGVPDSSSPVEEATYVVNVSADTYYLWARLFAPSLTNDAIYIGIDNTWDRTFATTLNQYQWVRIDIGVNGSYAFNLSSGNHTIRMGHGESLSRVDAIYLTSDVNDVPTQAPALDTTPPVISNINVSNIGQFSADISWTTNENADGQIEFLGPCPATGCLTPLVAILTTNHLINIFNLSPATSYPYEVRSKDAAGNLTISSSQLFTFRHNFTHSFNHQPG